MDSALGRHFADFGDFRATADLKSSSTLKSPKNYKSPTANPRIHFYRHCETCASKSWQSTIKNAKSGF